MMYDDDWSDGSDDNLSGSDDSDTRIYRIVLVFW